MINLSRISPHSALGRALRWPLRMIPKGSVVRVLQGPLRGASWVVGTTDHGAWLGTYEAPKQRLFARTVRPCFTVWDIGANVGLYTLLASRLVGAGGRVSAFEPFPENVRALKRHLDLNGVLNTGVVEKAVAGHDGVFTFLPSESNGQGRLAEGGRLPVGTVQLDTYWKSSGESPDVVKMDIEGEEAVALSGGAECLKTCHPTIFLATHSAELHVQCCEMLRDLGYRLAPVDTASRLESTDEIVATWVGSEVT